MRLYKRYYNYNRKISNLIKYNQLEIDTANHKLLNLMLFIATIYFSFILIFSIFSNAYSFLVFGYTIALCITLFLIMLKSFLQHRLNSTLFIYLGYGLFVSYTTLSSSILTPDYISVLILSLLFELPLIILDKDVRVNLIELLFATFYLSIVCQLKDDALRLDEIINVCSFTAIAMTLGSYLRKTRIENFELKRQAIIRENTDFLTGLSNRKKLFKDLRDNALPSSKLSITGILMIDIDYFKLYNDTYGHVAGDYCLRRISNCLHEFEQQHNLSCYRYGGEEFVMLWGGTSQDELNSLCTLLNKQVFALQISHSQSPLSFVTLSIGAYFQNKRNHFDYQLLLNQADKALYEAKNSGRNQAVLYDYLTFQND